MRLELSSFVAGDLAVIADYIAEDNPARALSFIKELRDRIREVAKRPEIYQVRPEIGAEARLALFGRYVILFRIVGKVVRVERVVYGSRDLVGLLDLDE